MRAIIIQDTDARALLDKLELAKLKELYAQRAAPPTLDDMHRTFHYVVTRWLQEHGADCVGR
jgi:hypothetical protein